MPRSNDDQLHITIPELTWQQAMILLFYFEEGKKIDSNYVQWDALKRECLRRFGFQPFDAASQLIESFDPPLLLHDGDPERGTHRIRAWFFRNPTPLFEAINKAERAQNAIVAKYEAATPEQRKLMRNPGKAVPITDPPSNRAESLLGRPAADPISTLVIGSITPDGVYEIVAGPDGRPARRLIPVLAEAAGPVKVAGVPSDSSANIIGRKGSSQPSTIKTQPRKTKKATPAGGSKATTKPAAETSKSPAPQAV